MLFLDLESTENNIGVFLYDKNRIVTFLSSIRNNIILIRKVSSRSINSNRNLMNYLVFWGYKIVTCVIIIRYYYDYHDINYMTTVF